MIGNPIGVGDLEDWPEDEYNAYVMPVYAILRQQKGEAALMAYLAQHFLSDTPQAQKKGREPSRKTKPPRRFSLEA